MSTYEGDKESIYTGTEEVNSISQGLGLDLNVGAVVRVLPRFPFSVWVGHHQGLIAINKSQFTLKPGTYVSNTAFLLQAGFLF